MTLETKENLQKLLNSNNESAFLNNRTDEEWQEVFYLIKENTEPTRDRRLYGMKSNSSIMRSNYRLSSGTKEETQNTYYIRFINDILNQLRLGHHDFCFHLFHVKELLRFYPFNLKTKLRDGCIEVWLGR